MNKKIQSSNLPFFILAIVDLLIINSVFRIAYFVHVSKEPSFSDHYVGLLVVFNMAWLFSAQFNKIDRIEKYDDVKSLSVNLFNTFFVHAFLVLGFIVSFKGYIYSRLFLTYTYISSVALITGLRLVFVHITRKYGNFGLKNRKVVIVGAEEAGKALSEYFTQYKYFGYKFMGFFDDIESSVVDPSLIMGDLNRLKSYCTENNIDEIYYTLPTSDKMLISSISRFAEENGIYFKIVPNFNLIGQKEVDFTFYGNIPIMTIRKIPLSLTFNQIIKRGFDIIFSITFITLIFPWLFPIIGLLIISTSKGSIFLKQLRPGRKNQLFECYKFRTVKVLPKGAGVETTKVGSILRRTGLDELPLFFNVLFGNMSAVGPRANMVKHLELYSTLLDDYNIRQYATPGLTGYAQVKIFNEDMDQMEVLKRKIEYDVKYIENWSLLLDIKILVLAFFNIFRKKPRQHKELA
ncbi:exopolysaccharide biosynthesis polyprenyl glycosylphosphotransferase [Flammeovirgaceae bacterium SG7u.111]|nr:exopolysaccharide biosynthesis polyprenyl glycosylphosphotransferase [Flammeovirgaceae bacterium SG7u.132]WPO35904.1 exopolysaccharide biosynthesis polyprenyl glycosylphosphotransferase [Flammeovirgaceae bacterium SG7u.111]